MAHPSEDLLRPGYEAFSTGDMQTLGGLFADDIIWHIGGRNSLTGDYRGKQEVFELFGKGEHSTITEWACTTSRMAR